MKFLAFAEPIFLFRIKLGFYYGLSVNNCNVNCSPWSAGFFSCWTEFERLSYCYYVRV